MEEKWDIYHWAGWLLVARSWTGIFALRRKGLIQPSQICTLRPAMSMPEIPQPHDSLIRYTLGSTENAASLFQVHLPASLAALLDWPRMRLEPGTFVGEELRRSESDLLYSVPMRGEDGREALLYLLLEHQSTSDRWLPLRLLGYMLAIWKQHCKRHPAEERLPLLLPLLLSQVAGGWRISPQFADLLQWPEGLREALEKHQPRFEHLSIDLAKLSRDQLEGTVEARLAQGVLKAAMEKDLLGWIDWAAPLMRVIGSLDFLRALLLYAANAESEVDLQRFLEKIKSAEIPKTDEAIMSIAEQLRMEGRAEAMSMAEQLRREGRVEGEQRGALVGRIQTLQGMIGRPESTIESLAHLDAAQLRALAAELKRELPESGPVGG